MRIAVDAMGGDHAPAHPVDGAVTAARNHGLAIDLIGRESAIRAELERHPDMADLDVRVIDAPDVIEMSESPAKALRRKPGASIRVAAEHVAAGRAVAMFSAGHTGASVVAAHAAFGMLPGVDRPALAPTVPTRGGAAVLLDAGARWNASRGTCCSLRRWARLTRGSAWASSSRGLGCCRSARKKRRAMS